MATKISNLFCIRGLYSDERGSQRSVSSTYRSSKTTEKDREGIGLRGRSGRTVDPESFKRTRETWAGEGGVGIVRSTKHSIGFQWPGLDPEREE